MPSKIEKIKKFIYCENNIKGILNTICNIEKNEGINNLKVINLNRLLNDFLLDEQKIINELIQNQSFFINYLLKNNFELTDDIKALFLDKNAVYGYKLVRLTSSLNDLDLINIDIYLELIKSSNDLDLKYQLSFFNPTLMCLLSESNFDHNQINLDCYKNSNYEIRKLSSLIKISADFIGFMIENDKVDDSICLNYLKVINKNIGDENISYIGKVLIKSGYESNKIEKIFANLKEKTYKKLD